MAQALNIPDYWLAGAVHTFRQRYAVTYLAAVEMAVACWVEQERLEAEWEAGQVSNATGVVAQGVSR